jgi:hypothetical protein
MEQKGLSDLIHAALYAAVRACTEESSVESGGLVSFSSFSLNST